MATDARCSLSKLLQVCTMHQHQPLQFPPNSNSNTQLLFIFSTYKRFIESFEYLLCNCLFLFTVKETGFLLLSVKPLIILTPECVGRYIHLVGSPRVRVDNNRYSLQWTSCGKPQQNSQSQHCKNQKTHNRTLRNEETRSHVLSHYCY